MLTTAGSFTKRERKPGVNLEGETRKVVKYL